MVELYCAKGAEIKYSTVQNWYAGDENGVGGIYNFVTKRGLCDGDDSKISWTQVWRFGWNGRTETPLTSNALPEDRRGLSLARSTSRRPLLTCLVSCLLICLVH